MQAASFAYWHVVFLDQRVFGFMIIFSLLLSHGFGQISGQWQAREVPIKQTAKQPSFTGWHVFHALHLHLQFCLNLNHCGHLADAAANIRSDSSPAPESSLAEAVNKAERQPDATSEASAGSSNRLAGLQKPSARQSSKDSTDKPPPVLPNVAILLETMRKRLEALNGPDLPRI